MSTPFVTPDSRPTAPALRPGMALLFALALGPVCGSRPAGEEAMRFNNLGIAQLEQFQFGRAAEWFARARASDPGFLPAIVNLGIARFYERGYEAAEAALNEAAGRDPRQIAPLYVLALVRRATGRDEDALRLMERVLTLDPADPSALYFAGTLHSVLRDWDSAVRYFRRTLERDPVNASAIYALARALIQKGDDADAEKAMALFKEWKIRGTGTSFGNQYGEQGRYALALRAAAPGEQPDAGGLRPAPRFVEAAAASGLKFTHSGPHGGRLIFDPEAASLPAGEAEIAFQGSGAAFFDADGDGFSDLLFADASAAGPVPPALFRNNGKGVFARMEGTGIGYRGRGMGVAAGDWDNDGRHDIFLAGFRGSALYHNEGGGKFREVTGLLSPRLQEAWALSAAFADLDHDGDADLLVACADLPPLLFRNNGNGTFTEAGSESRIPSGRRTSAVAILDYNESRDIDLLLLEGRLRLAVNRRDGSFGEAAGPMGPEGASAAAGMAVGDFDGDGFDDICLPGNGGASIYWNRNGERWTAAPAAPAVRETFWNARAFDYDNDGDLDLLLVGNRLRLLENKGARVFRDATRETGLDRIVADYARSILVCDYDRDGDLDTLITRCAHPPLLLRNEGGNRNHALRLSLEGKPDNRLGTGSKVDWAAAGLWQRRLADGGLGFMSQSAGDLLLGLGRFRRPDFVRVLWPSGVLQTETPEGDAGSLRLSELDRKGTSCPILYAWDGARYGFVSDFLGGSALGYWTAPGRYAVPDTDEYVKIPARALMPRNGMLSLRMANQLEEVILFDMVRLLAVDHPESTEIHPNERLQASLPFPEFRIHTAVSPRALQRALDQRGRDWTDALRAEDRDYVRGFSLLPFKGYAEEHALELRLGDLRRAERVLLLMDGWIDYATSSSNFAARQAGLSLLPPRLEVLEQGAWRTVLPDMGFPAGLPKTMTVDLSGSLPLSEDVRVRIVTNMRLYWDRIRIETGAPDPNLRLTTLAASGAAAGWIGYPLERSPDGAPPFGYDFDRREAAAPWKTHLGGFTRLGDVRELLEAVDDRYVILAHGEAIAADFDAARLPPLPPGWVRDWLLYVDGFGKDMDRHSEHPDRLEPLPRHRDLPYRRPHWNLPAEAAWEAFRLGALTRQPW